MRIRHSFRYLAVAAGLMGPWACGGSDLFDPEAEQGIEVLALLGPMCPVQSLDDPCPDRPHQAWVSVRAVDGTLVTRFQTGIDGRAQVGLLPGRYTLDPEGGNPFPAVSEQDVEVLVGLFADVVISFDTGIR